MARFVVRRLLLLVPILLASRSCSSYGCGPCREAPHRHCSVSAPRRTRSSASTTQYGLDRPITTQYLAYMRTTLRGDLGTSVTSRRPVTTEIRERFRRSEEIGCGRISSIQEWLDAAAFREKPKYPSSSNSVAPLPFRMPGWRGPNPSGRWPSLTAGSLGGIPCPQRSRALATPLPLPIRRGAAACR